MPSQLRRLQMRAALCVAGTASCDEHEKIRVRIRKQDLEEFGESHLHEVDIYAQSPCTEALRVRLGSILEIELKEGSTLHFTVIAIHVLPSLSKKNGFVRTGILSGYVSEYRPIAPKNTAQSTAAASSKSSMVKARRGPSYSAVSTGDT